MIPLLTSVPQKISRIDKAGQEIGGSYQKMCIESWFGAGFRPISVHSNDEPAPEGLDVTRVSRDARAINGKPLVYISDIIALGREIAEGGVFAIGNADLLFHPELGGIVASIPRGAALISRRIDIESIGDRSGTRLKYGFDFFAMHGADVEVLPDIGLVMGLPWWDHWLPVLMAQNGIRLLQVEAVTYHLVHPLQWLGTWSTLGKTFLQNARHHIHDPDLRASYEFVPSSIRRTIRKAAARMIPHERRWLEKEQLKLATKINLNYIDGISTGLSTAAV